MNKDLLEMLQVFHDADDGANGGGTPPDPNDGDKDDDPNDTLNLEGLTDEQVKAIKEKFGFKDDNEVDNIVKSKHARLREEAERLAKMNEEERAAEEKKKLEEKIAEYERERQQYQMSQEATKMLSEAEIPYDDGLVQLVIGDNAETTKERVQAIVNLASKIKKENARQQTPGVGGAFGSKGTNQSFAEMAKETRKIK